MVLCPVARLCVRAQPAHRPVPGSLCAMGEDRGVHYPRHLRFGADRPGNSQYIALFLQHGESEPESAAPVVWVFVGTAVFYQQQRSEKRREGGGGQLPDAGQYGPEDSVGAVGEALRLHQVHTYFNQENMIKVLDTILCTDSKPLHHL